MGTPPWEAKKKAENKQQEQKTDKLGAPWEKKKNEDLAQKAGNAPWENKKENKATPPWTKKQEQKEVPPWQQKDSKKDEVIDLETSPWQQQEDEEMGPPPWLQQQQQNVGKDTPKPLFGKVKEEPLFDSRKRSYGSMQQIKPRYNVNQLSLGVKNICKVKVLFIRFAPMKIFAGNTCSHQCNNLISARIPTKP